MVFKKQIRLLTNMPCTGRRKGPAVISKSLEKKIDKEVGDVDESKAAPGIPVLNDVDMLDAVVPRGQRRARKPAVKEESLSGESEDDMPLVRINPCCLSFGFYSVLTDHPRPRREGL
jgi:hypothetical protein